VTSDRVIRASDQDRERVVDVLRDAYTAGRLDLTEFDERTTSAYSAKTWGELRDLTADLPQQPRIGADLPAGTPGHPEAPAPRLAATWGELRDFTADLPQQPRIGADTPAGRRDRARRRPSVLLPMALGWFAIMALTHSFDAAILIVVLFFLAFSMTARPPGRPPKQSRDSRRADDQA
jgi:hypothetical protein